MFVTYQVPAKKLEGGARKEEEGPLDGEEVLLALRAGSMNGGRRTDNWEVGQALPEAEAETSHARSK